MNQGPTPQIQPPPKTGQYFEERRRGQMNQLKNLLNNLINDPESKKGRQVVRKVIGYMTLGMDASLVFSEMCRASYTNDEVTKKMIYFYLTTYAQDNADLAIMAVNTFKKDCKHASSKVRGLALRNLCSFRSIDYVNNVLPLIRQLLHDFEPYVKKTAIIGVLKVFYHQPATIFNDESIISTLSGLIKDADPLVSANALMALHQILMVEGGIPLTSKLVNYLLSRLKQYNEWSQTTILDLLYNYTPINEKENFQIMTILWDKLKHSSTSLVLASIKIIIKLSKDNQQLFKNVIEKIKSPLLTLMTGNENSGFFENSFIILEHIDYVISEMGGKVYYEKDFKYFYCRADQPTYTKLLKIKILGRLANQYNLGDMLNQLNDYATDIDILIARKSIQVLANIAINLPQVAKALVANLVAFCKIQQTYIINQTVCAFYQILRKYPNLFGDIKSALLSNFEPINQNQSIKAFLWILGTFAQQIQQSPYIIQDYIDGKTESLTGNFQQFNDQIKSVLLTQTVQIFLKRPPQTFETLNRIFKLVFNSDKSSMMLRDHAGFYYRALKDNPNDVKKAMTNLGNQLAIRQQGWGNNAEQDFNNMAIVYKRKENKFIKNYQYFQTMRSKELGIIQPKIQQEQEADIQQQLNGQIDGQFTDYSVIEAHNLQQKPTLSAQQFQQTWNALSEYNQYQMALDESNIQLLDEESVEQLFKMWHIYCIAAAEDQNVLKFYVYCCHTDGQYACMEIQIDKSLKTFSLNIKANKSQFVESTKIYIEQFLMLNQFLVNNS